MGKLSRNWDLFSSTALVLDNFYVICVFFSDLGWPCIKDHRMRLGYIFSETWTDLSQLEESFYKNKDENVLRFALSAFRERNREKERKRERKRERERKKARNNKQNGNLYLPLREVKQAN